ncbi:MAG: hypothetical protein K9J77_00500, partial [Rhodoferax sp.]|nr:hypothetical protein [Rhodoferax sp.]
AVRGQQIRGGRVKARPRPPATAGLGEEIPRLEAALKGLHNMQRRHLIKASLPYQNTYVLALFLTNKTLWTVEPRFLN